MHIWRDKRSSVELAGSGRRCANGESEGKRIFKIFFLKKSLSILFIFPFLCGFASGLFSTAGRIVSSQIEPGCKQRPPGD